MPMSHDINKKPPPSVFPHLPPPTRFSPSWFLFYNKDFINLVLL